MGDRTRPPPCAVGTQATLAEGRASLQEAPLITFSVEALREQIRGDVIGEADEEYDLARRVYNAMIDRRPALIARCANTADVAAACTAVNEASRWRSAAAATAFPACLPATTAW